MSADLLREAASLARELADRADEQPAVNVNVEGVWLGSRFYMVTTPARERAVADWLDATAAENDSPEDSALGFLNFVTADAHAALAVARTYLGTT